MPRKTAPKTAAPPPPTCWLIAENKRIGRAWVEKAWGWKRDGQGWLDSRGHHVRWCSDARRLEREPQHTVVYAAHRWYAWIQPHVMHEIAKRQGLVLVENPAR